MNCKHDFEIGLQICRKCGLHWKVAMSELLGKTERLEQKVAEYKSFIERVVLIQDLLLYPDNTEEEHIGEAMAVSKMLGEARELVAKNKGDGRDE